VVVNMHVHFEELLKHNSSHTEQLMHYNYPHFCATVCYV
jgi:hypothetical protein